MAIRVICSGCMTSFEVSDRFAGKKGPCPKCNHIIEIPREKLTVHAPDQVVGAKGKGGVNINQARPILQKRFNFTTQQLGLTLLGVAVVLLLVFGLSFFPNGIFKNILGAVGSLALGFPLICFGYMLLREDDDLEILLGNELYRRSLLTGIGFGVVWLVFELLLSYLQPGYFFPVVLVPLAVLGAFVAVVAFDTDFNRAAVLMLFYIFVAIFLRGIFFAPNGWVWSQPPTRVRAAPASASSTETTFSEEYSESGELLPAPKPAKPPVKPLPATAPDAKSNLRR